MQFLKNTTTRDDLDDAALIASMRAIKICRESAIALPFDLDEHMRWCDERRNEKMMMKVSEPESRGSYLKKHTTFLVTESVHGYRVRRRFSDFEWLHTVLKARYIGLLIPSIPEKNVLKSEAFVQSRIRGLQLFLEHVAASPYLAKDPAVVVFLTKTDELEWESARKETEVMENGGPGHLRWIKRIATFKLPPNAEHEITVFKRHVEQQEKVLMEVVACTKRLVDKSQAMCKEVGTLFSLFNGWSVSETTAPDQNPKFLSTLAQTTTIVSDFNKVMHHEPSIFELVLHESLKYLYHQVKDMKEILMQRDAALQASTSHPTATSSTGSAAASAANIANASAAAVANAASSFASRFRSSSEPHVASTPGLDAELAKQRSQEIADLITCALMAQEIEEFRVQKNTALEDAMSHFAFAQGQLAKTSSSMWREYIKSNTKDHQALLQSTKLILEGTTSQESAEAF